MKVTLNGQVMNPLDYAADVDGVNWLVTGLDGWDSPDIRASVVTPTARHGDVTAKALLASRSLTLYGLVKASTLAGFYTAQNRLQEFSSSMVVPMSFVVEEDIERVCYVVRAGRVRTTPAGLRALTFEMPLTAPDPLKYAVTPVVTSVAAGASGVLTNVGNFTSENYEVEADADGDLKVINTTFGTRGLTTDSGVASGTVFNGLARTVYDGDNPAYGVLGPSAVWWGILPGANAVDNDGTAAVTITYRPAWL